VIFEAVGVPGTEGGVVSAPEKYSYAPKSGWLSRSKPAKSYQTPAVPTPAFLAPLVPVIRKSAAAAGEATTKPGVVVTTL